MLGTEDLSGAGMILGATLGKVLNQSIWCHAKPAHAFVLFISAVLPRGYTAKRTDDWDPTQRAAWEA